MVVFVTQSKWHSRVKEQKEDGWLKQARPGRILSLHIFNKFYALSMCCCREKDEKSPGELLDRIFTELSPLLGKRPALCITDDDGYSGLKHAAGTQNHYCFSFIQK
jgi:hypothetical protein